MGLVGAIIITYFLSRAFRRVVSFKTASVRLIAPHVMSMAVVIVMLFALRYPLYVLHKEQLIPYIIGQGIWVMYDAYRSAIMFWKAPVVETTGSSAKAPGASSR